MDLLEQRRRPGDVMLVPLHADHEPSRAGTEERTLTPGAVTSGFICSEMGVGPPDEKLAITFDLEAAAEVIARGAVPGEPTDPRPNPSKSFPAATAGTTPACAAPSIA